MFEHGTREFSEISNTEFLDFENIGNKSNPVKVDSTEYGFYIYGIMIYHHELHFSFNIWRQCAIRNCTIGTRYYVFSKGAFKFAAHCASRIRTYEYKYQHQAVK